MQRWRRLVVAAIVLNRIVEIRGRRRGGLVAVVAKIERWWLTGQQRGRRGVEVEASRRLIVERKRGWVAGSKRRGRTEGCGDEVAVMRHGGWSCSSEERR